MFFISYSSKDRAAAEKIVRALENQGTQVWVDFKNMREGEEFFATRISEALRETKILLFLVSKNSGGSPWCRLEYENVLRREIARSKSKIIPIKVDNTPLPPLFASRGFLRLEQFENVAPSLVDLTSDGLRRSLLKFEDQTIPFVPDGLIEGLTFLLLRDQYELGVWGRSIAAVKKDYSPEDNEPGSITVSTWACEALSLVSGFDDLPEINRFSAFLESHRLANGAFGMMKAASGYEGGSRLSEHRRHTGLAAKHLYRYKNDVSLAQDSIEHLTQCTEDGAWAATPNDPIGADPLTTAHVLGVLRFFEGESLFPVKTRNFQKNYWKRGLLWMYEKLANDGWGYQNKGRVFCYTADCLDVLPEFADEHRDYKIAQEQLFIKLFAAWESVGSGIPTGPSSLIPHLQTTANYASSVWQCRWSHQNLNEKVQGRFASDVESILSEGDSDAAGWALTLKYVCNAYGKGTIKSSTLNDLRQMALMPIEKLSASSNDLLPPWALQVAAHAIDDIDY